MEDLTDDDINQFISRISQEQSDNVLDLIESHPKFDGNNYKEMMEIRIIEKDEKIKEVLQLVSTILINLGLLNQKLQHQKMLQEEQIAHYENEIQVINSENEQLQQHIQEQESVNENQAEKNEQLFEQIQRLEDDLANEKHQSSQIEIELNKQQQILRENIGKNEKNEQIMNELQKNYSEIEETYSKQRSELIKSSKQIEKLLAKSKDQEEKIVLKDQEIKNLIKEVEKLKLSSSVEQNSQQDSARKEKTQFRNKSNTLFVRSDTMHARSQSHFIGQFNLEQFKEQHAASVKSEPSDSDNDDQTDKKTLKQENDEQQEQEQIIIQLKALVDEQTQKLINFEDEKKKLENQLISIMSELSAAKIQEKKMTLKLKQSEKKLLDLQQGKKVIIIRKNKIIGRIVIIRKLAHRYLKLSSKQNKINNQ